MESNPVLALDSEVCKDSFTQYICALQRLFNSDMNEETLGVFNQEVDRLKKVLGLSKVPKNYKGLRILERDNAIKVLAFLAVYKNSRIINEDFEYFRREKVPIGDVLDRYARSIRRNSLLGDLNETTGEAEVKRRIVLSFWVTALLHDMRLKVLPYIELPLFSLERISAEMFSFLEQIVQTTAFRAALRRIPELKAARIPGVLRTLKESSYFCDRLPEGVQGVSVLGNNVILTKEYDYTTQGSRNERVIKKVSFESTLIHELGHILYRFHKEENWYKLSPEKPCKRIRMTQGTLNEEVKLPQKRTPSDTFEETQENEMGNHLETQLFGFRIEEMNLDLASFLVEIHNWNASLESFQEEVLKNYRQGVSKGQKSFKMKKSVEYRAGIAGCFYDINRHQVNHLKHSK